MKKLFLYVFAASFSAVFFFPFPASAQKNKKVDAKSVSSSKPAPTAKAAPVANKPPQAPPPTATTVSAMEQAVFDEINAARRDPKKYMAYLEDYKKLLKGRTLYLPNQPRLETNEGAAAADDAINFLKSVGLLSPYKLSGGLNKSAALQLKDLVLDSSLRHKGRDGSDLPTRLKKFGTYGSIYAENISYFGDTARDVVLGWIIDDGWKSRSHRRNIFSPTFKVVGVACGKGKTGDGLCVINLADSFTESGSPGTGVREF